MEYACVGLSQEAAVAKYGGGCVEGYHTNMTPTEWAPPDLWKPKNACAVKIIVQLPATDAVAMAVEAGQAPSSLVPPEEQRVVGLHFLGPHAGEVIQGFAAALQTGALTLATLRATVGVHPTLAEEFTYAEVTSSSGASGDKALCCG
jgi:thioredoxin reductase (NADPH)